MRVFSRIFFILLVGGDGLASPLGGNFSRLLRLFLAELVDVFTACRDSDAIGEGVGGDVVVLHGIFLSGFRVFLPFVDLIIAQIAGFVKHFFKNFFYEFLFTKLYIYANFARLERGRATQ